MSKEMMRPFMRRLAISILASTASCMAVAATLELEEDFNSGIDEWTYRSEGVSEMSFMPTIGFPHPGSLQLLTNIGLAEYQLSEAVSECFPATGNESFVLFANVYKMSRDPSERCTLNVVFYPSKGCIGERSFASIPAPIPENVWTQLKRPAQTFGDTQSVEVALQSIAAPVAAGDTLCRFDNVRLFRSEAIVTIPSLSRSSVVVLAAGFLVFAIGRFHSGR